MWPFLSVFGLNKWQHLPPFNFKIHERTFGQQIRQQQHEFIKKYIRPSLLHRQSLFRVNSIAYKIHILVMVPNIAVQKSLKALLKLRTSNMMERAFIVHNNRSQVINFLFSLALCFVFFFFLCAFSMLVRRFVGGSNRQYGVCRLVCITNVANHETAM